MNLFADISFVLILLIPLAISLVDYINVFRSRIRRSRKKLTVTLEDSTDFTILVPIFGDIRYLKNVDFLRQYRKHVILCTTTKETVEFSKNIDTIAKQYDFRVFRSPVHLASKHHVSNPMIDLFPFFKHTGFYNKDLARDEAIKDSFAAVKTKYILFLDGDTYAEESLHQLIDTMNEKKYDVASVRVLAAQPVTLIQKLQAVEYEIAMNSRKIYPWLTSGAATLAKTDILRKIMKHHSLYFQGGDIEVGRLAVMMNYSTGYIPFVFFTDVPDTFTSWWKQRAGWFGGSFRHSVINWNSHGWRYPFYSFYNTFLIFLALPLRWYEVVFHPKVLPLVFLLYTLLILIFHWRHRQWFYFLFPVYALLQIMIIVPVGIYTYFKMSFRSNNVGLIKLRY